MIKYYLYLTTEERNLIIESLVIKKNHLFSIEKFTDGIDETLLKTTKAKRKKIRVI